MQHIIPMELTDLNSSISMKLRPTYGGLSGRGVVPYSDIATFETNIAYPLRKLLAKITAQQDLHGYSHPWAGGAGNNIFPLDVATIKAANTIGTWNGNAYTVYGVTFTLQTDDSGNILGINLNGTATGSYNFLIQPVNTPIGVAQGRYTFSSGTTGSSSTTSRIYWEWYNTSTSAWAGSATDSLTTSHDTDKIQNARIQVFSGATFSNKVYKPMLNAGQTAIPFEPYTNICKINGFDEVEVNVSGKNFCPQIVPSATTGAVIITPQDGGAVKVNGTATSTYSTPAYRIPLKAGTYIVTCDMPNTHSNITGVQINGIQVATKNIPQTVTLASDGSITLNYRINAGDTINNEIWKPMLRLAGTSDTWEPYNGNTYTTDLGGTYYGGTLDVTTGVLTVTHAGIDMGSIGWAYLATFQAFTGPISGCILPAIGSNHIPISSAYKGRTPYYITGLENGGIMYNSSGDAGVFVKNTAYTDATAFKTAVTGQTIVYELATPQTVQLTAQEIDVFIGRNNIWADSGQVYVEFYFVEDFEE